MSSREDRIRAFSCPMNCAAHRRGFLEELMVAQVKAQITGFLFRNGALLERGSDGLGEFLRKWLSGPTTLSVVAGLPVDVLLQCHENKNRNPVWAATQVAVCLAARGVAGEFEARWRDPSRVRLHCHVTAHSTKLRLSARHDAVDITLDDGSVTTLRHGEMERSPSSGWQRLASVQMHQAQMIVWSDETRDVCALAPELEFAREPVLRSADTLREAIALVRASCPVYIEWIDDTARSIVPTAAAPQTSTSHSNADNPSVIHASFPSDPLRAAEVLIHECSHQYYLLLQTRHRLATFDDDTLYYSPYAKADRHIERILLAFHAFANVAIFYRACMDNGGPEPQRCRQTLSEQLIRLERLSDHIDRSPAITRAGRLLYEPLAQKIFA